MPCGVRTFLDITSRSSATPSRTFYFSQHCLNQVIRPTTLMLMLILLPPSEGKTTPEHGAPLDFNSLLFPELSGERRTILQELEVVSSLGNAHEVLKVGKTLTAEIEANQHILDVPAAPGWQVYSGGLFDDLVYGSFDNDDGVTTLVFSALFGVTRLSDTIPAYRYPATAKQIGRAHV